MTNFDHGILHLNTFVTSILSHILRPKNISWCGFIYQTWFSKVDI